jgi:hypothetical protein
MTDRYLRSMRVIGHELVESPPHEVCDAVRDVVERFAVHYRNMGYAADPSFEECDYRSIVDIPLTLYGRCLVMAEAIPRSEEYVRREAEAEELPCEKIVPPVMLRRDAHSPERVLGSFVRQCRRSRLDIGTLQDLVGSAFEVSKQIVGMHEFYQSLYEEILPEDPTFGEACRSLRPMFLRPSEEALLLSIGLQLPQYAAWE